MHTAPSERRHGPDRGQSAVIGYALLIAIALLGTTVVLALGSVAVTDTQTTSRVQNAEHSMTLFDSRASRVALGDSGTQSVDFGQGSGDYAVKPDSGEIRIIHVNYDGSDDDGNEVWDGPSDDDDYQIYHQTLGAVEFSEGDTIIAYQGGGVWRQGTGNPRMVSPPEFHYQGATLTLPLVTVDDPPSGGSAGGGSVSARIRADSDEPSFARQYPDPGTTYPNGREYSNPVEDGYIKIIVESEYRQAWADYFRTRTDGNVELTDGGTPIDRDGDGKEEVTLSLETLGPQQSFSFSSSTDTVPVRGFSGGASDHGDLDFQLDIRPTGASSAQFSNMQWSMWAQDGNEQFEIAFQPKQGGGTLKCGGGGGTTTKVRMNVYYTEDNGDTYHGWSTDDVDATCLDTDGDGTDDQIELDLDLTAGSSGDSADIDGDGTDESLTPTDLGGGDRQLNKFRGDYDSGDRISNDVLLSGASHAHSGRSYSDSDQERPGFVVAHYIANMGPTFDYNVYETQGGSSADMCYEGDTSGCEPSGGYITYDGNGRVVTFLHVTENRVEVEFN